MAGLCFSTIKQSLEKDWLVVLSNNNTEWLTETNSVMTQIDLLCNTAAPAVRRRGGARIRWRQMSSLDQRGHLWSLCAFFICMCVPMCDISILFYCYVSTLTPLYVRPLNQQTINHQLYILSYDNRYVDGGVHASDGGRCHPSIRGDICNVYEME